MHESQLKTLGFRFSEKPMINLHVETMIEKFRARFWGMRKQKRTGMMQTELVTVYFSVLRPLLEFA